jgi:hypothetical protein
MATPAFVPALFKSIDDMDAARFAEFITPDGTFRFGNNPPAVGRAQITTAVGGFFGALGGLAHTIHGVWSADGRVFVQGEVVYTRKDGTSVTLPFFDLFEMDGEAIRTFLVYADVTPIWQ